MKVFYIILILFDTLMLLLTVYLFFIMSENQINELALVILTVSFIFSVILLVNIIIHYVELRA